MPIKNTTANTVVEMEMADGSVVRLTLAYRFLLKLSSVNRRAYDEYNAVYNKKEGKREEIDNIRILYAAYLCAAIQDGTEDSAMSWDSFIDSVSLDREVTNNAMLALISPKRLGDTAMRSSAERKQAE